MTKKNKNNYYLLSNRGGKVEIDHEQWNQPSLKSIDQVTKLKSSRPYG
jgi:hypothetical protein